MSHAYFDDPIECPECGYSTSELLEATSTNTGERILMCQGCYEETEEGVNELNEYGEEREVEWEGDFIF